MANYTKGKSPATYVIRYCECRYIVLALTYNLSQLTSVHHPVLVHRADKKITFCTDNSLKIQEETNGLSI